MSNMSQICLIGHLGRDAEAKFMANDKCVVSFSIAVTRKRKDAEETTWWRCQWWGDRAAKVAGFLVKGKAVCVTGEAYQREYVGKEGDKRTSLEVDVRDLVLLGGGPAAQDGGVDPTNPEARPAAPARPARPARPAAEDGDPPF